MLESLLILFISWITNLLSSTGYAGVFILMTLESAGIPIPSEVIMPFAGYLVYLQKLNFYGAVFAGTFANLVGSLIAYFIAKIGGRPLINKIGRYIFLSQKDLDASEKFFQKYGSITIFISRVLPVFRTYISFPAGLARMPLFKFSFYTFWGSLPWSILLTGLGVKAGENWFFLREKFKGLEILAIAALLFLIFIFIWRHRRD